MRLCDVAPEPLAVCDAECELPSSNTLCFELDRDDSGDEFFRECEEECEVRAVSAAVASGGLLK